MNTANLKKRLIFVAWAVPLGWWVINSNLSIVPPNIARIIPAHLATVAVILGACIEYTKLLETLFSRNGFWLGYLWIVAEYSLYLLNISLPANLSIYILLMFVAFEAFVWGEKMRRWSRASMFFSGNVFLYIAGISILNLFSDPFQSCPW